MGHGFLVRLWHAMKVPRQEDLGHLVWILSSPCDFGWDSDLLLCSFREWCFCSKSRWGEDLPPKIDKLYNKMLMLRFKLYFSNSVCSRHCNGNILESRRHCLHFTVYRWLQLSLGTQPVESSYVCLRWTGPQAQRYKWDDLSSLGRAPLMKGCWLWDSVRIPIAL